MSVLLLVVVLATLTLSALATLSDEPTNIQSKDNDHDRLVGTTGPTPCTVPVATTRWRIVAGTTFCMA